MKKSVRFARSVICLDDRENNPNGIYYTKERINDEENLQTAIRTNFNGQPADERLIGIENMS